MRKGHPHEVRTNLRTETQRTAEQVENWSMVLQKINERDGIEED